MPTLHNRSRYALSLAFVATLAVTADSPAEASPPEELTVAAGESLEVAPEVWALLKDKPAVKRWQAGDRPMLSVTEGALTRAAKLEHIDPSKVDLATFSAPEACEYIETIGDVDELKTIFELDQRKTVRAAIRKRITELGG